MGTCDGKVAIVTGATRGIGKGCALELGAQGAVVYVTGRSVSEADHVLPGTVGATAAEVSELGGHGVGVACDHRDDDQVRRLFKQVISTHGRLDVVINSAFIIPDELMSGLKFWEVPLSHWGDMVDVGTRAAYVTSVLAAPIMVKQQSGLIINISSSGAEEYAWNVAYGVGKCALDRLTRDTAHELHDYDVAVVSLWPGFVRTERIDAALASDVQLPSSLTTRLETSESSRFTGRAVAALTSDGNVQRWSGQAVTSRHLAEHYAFTDLDGSLPDGPLRNRNG